jgi:SPP1 gp7 family putative phage head morphogenesis protein
VSLIGATLAHRRALMAYEETATRAVVASSEARLSPLLARLRAIEERLLSDRPPTALQLARAERDRARLVTIIRQTRADTRAVLQQRLTGAIQAELRVSADNLTAALPEGMTARAPGIDLQTLLFHPIAGSPWTQRVDASMVKAYDRMDAALLVALDRGASMPNAARLLGEALGGADSLGHDLTRIARTEIQRVSNEAAQATYRANVDVLQAVRYLATLDARACQVCRPLHRNVYPLDENGNHAGPTIPQHPNCRCFYAPVPRSLSDILASAA